MRSVALVSVALTTAAAFNVPVVPRGACRTPAPLLAAEGEAHATLCFVRHGQSEWNELNLFTGWADCDLTALGREEARAGAADLAQEGIEWDVAFTSLLTRAQNTLAIVLDGLDRPDLPVVPDYRLNERHYGALQGKDKKEMVAKFGAEQVKLWRRSYDVPPPPVELDSEHAPHNDPRYDHVSREALPRCECLKDTVERCLPFWRTEIEPALRRGDNVLVVAHGNSIRGCVKLLDEISDAGIAGVEIPTGVPLLYRLDRDLQPLPDLAAVAPLRGAFVGDAEAVAAARDKVAKQTAAPPAGTQEEAHAALVDALPLKVAEDAATQQEA